MTSREARLQRWLGRHRTIALTATAVGLGLTATEALATADRLVAAILAVAAAVFAGAFIALIRPGHSFRRLAGSAIAGLATFLGIYSALPSHSREGPAIPSSSCNATAAPAGAQPPRVTRLLAVADSSDGQIVGGDIFRAVTATGGAYVDPTTADIGSQITLVVLIYDAGPGVLTNVRLQITGVPSAPARWVRLELVASSIDSDPRQTKDSATINITNGAEGCLNYISGSSYLADSNKRKLDTLPDGITQGGVAIGDVGAGPTDRRYVFFRERVSRRG